MGCRVGLGEAGKQAIAVAGVASVCPPVWIALDVCVSASLGSERGGQVLPSMVSYEGPVADTAAGTH
jgi:hypothetical protein